MVASREPTNSLYTARLCERKLSMIFSRSDYIDGFVSITEYPKKGRCSIEIIKELDRMVEDLLRVFAGSCNGHLPNKIVFYRDGVDEGHFEKVLGNEVNKIKDACRSKFFSYFSTKQTKEISRSLWQSSIAINNFHRGEKASQYSFLSL